VITRCSRCGHPYGTRAEDLYDRHMCAACIRAAMGLRPTYLCDCLRLTMRALALTGVDGREDAELEAARDTYRATLSARDRRIRALQREIGELRERLEERVT